MLPIERKILRELSSVYLAGGLIVLGVYMTLELGSIPQWLTTIVANAEGNLSSGADQDGQFAGLLASHVCEGVSAGFATVFAEQPRVF
jgi:hypothetical protein